MNTFLYLSTLVVAMLILDVHSVAANQGQRCFTSTATLCDGDYPDKMVHSNVVTGHQQQQQQGPPGKRGPSGERGEKVRILTLFPSAFHLELVRLAFCFYLYCKLTLLMLIEQNQNNTNLNS